MLEPADEGEALMELQLDEDDVAVLDDVLTRYLGDLSAEISHTDNPAYRHRLRDRQEALRRVLAVVRSRDAGAPPQTA